MTKTIIRFSAAFAAIALILTLMAAGLAAPSVLAAADDKPVFSISTDLNTVSTGSQIIVSVSVENDTADTITSFSGELRFDTRFFRYTVFEDQLSMDGSVSVVSTEHSNGRLSFVYTGTELTNSRINNGEDVVFIKFLFTAITNYDTTGQFFVGTINDCYFDTVNIGVIDCETESLTVRSTTAAIPTTATTAAIQLSSDARLASLTLENCQLSPVFNSEFVAYTASVPYETASIRIDATASSSAAIVSGLGVKDLAVGVNNYTVTVLAENGNIKEYGIIITRLEYVPVPEETTTTIPTETTTAPEPTSTEPEETTTVATLTTAPPISTVIDDGSEDNNVTDGVLQIVGIVFGEIALFFFGFLSGFFVDKNLRRKGERRDDYDDYDDYDDEDDYEDRRPNIFTPSGAVYPDGAYIDPGYQPQYGDPQMMQPQPVDPSFIPFAANGQIPVMDPQQFAQYTQGQYGDSTSYPDSNYDQTYYS